MVTVFVGVMLFTNSYRVIERWIIAFVSVIGLSFIYELALVDIEWGEAARAWVTPSFPDGSMVVVMSVLGAVVMPHNLFLHSEVIQSRRWDLEDDRVIRKQLRYEFLDTSLSMLIGWAINSAMILLAAATFFREGTAVNELQDASTLLQPLLGKSAAVVFAIALLFAGIASTITSGMAAGSIFAGIYREPYDIKDSHSRWGILISLLAALALIMLIRNPFMGLPLFPDGAQHPTPRHHLPPSPTHLLRARHGQIPKPPLHQMAAVHAGRHRLRPQRGTPVEHGVVKKASGGERQYFLSLPSGNSVFLHYLCGSYRV